MEKLKFDNYVGGKNILLSNKRFVVQSPFYPDYSALGPESNAFDIRNAISKARTASKALAVLSFDERKAILKKASEKLKFTKEEVEYVVRMNGMPISAVETVLSHIPAVLTEIPRLVEKRMGTSDGRIVSISEGDNMFVVFHPVSGFAYCITPGNDPRTNAFVAGWLAVLGIPGIIKPSKADLLISNKIIQAITEAGYPSGGLNLLCWDTAAPHSAQKNFDIVGASSVVWAFGEDHTVDSILRFQQTENGIKDHFVDKIVIRHASGRGAAVFDDASDLKKCAQLAVESAFQWPVGCNSLKAVFYAGAGGEEFKDKVKELVKKEYCSAVGDPMDPKTRVGFTDPKTLAHLLSRVKDLETLKLLKPMLPIKEISSIQVSPLLLLTNDSENEFLSKEHSTYVLGMKKCASFEEALVELNSSAGKNKRIAVSVYTDDKYKTTRHYIHAHHVRRMRHTNELDLLFHEGNDYVYRLTVPQVHRLEEVK